MLYMNKLAMAAMSLLAVGAEGGEGYGDTWRICTVINNVRDLLRFWGSALIMCIGVVMCIVGIWKIAQALISHGKTQVSWVVNISLIVVGILFCAGSAFFMTMTNDGNESLGGALANELEALGTEKG